MLPKKGRKFPIWRGALAGRRAYTEVMAELLQKEHGDSHRAVKELIRQTNASERTAKHWLAAQHGPDTVFFLRLIATSPVIRAFVLGIIESSSRDQQFFPPGRSDYHTLLMDARAAGSIEHPLRENDLINDLEHDPINDPIAAGLNERQRWFLDRVGRGIRSKSYDIIVHWNVSPKTARRDIAGLRSSGLLQFVGARRNGRYQVTDN